VFLIAHHYFSRPEIILNNLSVRISSEKNVALFRMKLDAERCLTVYEAFSNLPCFCIPKLKKSIISSSSEASSIRLKLAVSDSLRMTHVGAHALPVGINVPDFCNPVVGGGKEEMAGFRNELNSLDALAMADVAVEKLLGNEAVMLLRPQVGGSFVPLLSVSSLRVLCSVEDCLRLKCQLFGVSFLLHVHLLFFLLL
jgi:hypothetical protein